MADEAESESSADAERRASAVRAWIALELDVSASSTTAREAKLTCSKTTWASRSIHLYGIKLSLGWRGFSGWTYWRSCKEDMLRDIVSGSSYEDGNGASTSSLCVEC